MRNYGTDRVDFMMKVGAEITGIVCLTPYEEAVNYLASDLLLNSRDIDLLVTIQLARLKSGWSYRKCFKTILPMI